MPTEELTSLLKEAKPLAKRYRELTGRPLGIVWEIAEFEVVARFLGLGRAPVRTAGYDAIRRLPGGAARPTSDQGSRHALRRDCVLLVLPHSCSTRLGCQVWPPAHHLFVYRPCPRGATSGATAMLRFRIPYCYQWVPGIFG